MEGKDENMYEELKDIVVEIPRKGHPATTPLPGPITTLDQLYKDGWWVSEIFGSQLVLIKNLPKGNCRKPKFQVVYKSVAIENISKKALATIKRIQKNKWKKYGPILTQTKK